MADSKAGVLKEALRRVRAKALDGSDLAKKSRYNDPKGQKYDGKPDSKEIPEGDTEDAMDELSKASEEKRRK